MLVSSLTSNQHPHSAVTFPNISAPQHKLRTTISEVWRHGVLMGFGQRIQYERSVIDAHTITHAHT